MSVELKLVFASVQEAANALAKLGAPTTAAPAPAATTEKPAAKTKETPAAGTSKDSSSAAAAASPAPAESKAAAAEKPAETPKADAPTYEKSGLPEKIKAAVGKDKAGVIALLKEFGVAKGPELKPEQFAAFGEKIDALIGGGDLA